MKTYIVKLILDNKTIQTVSCSAYTRSQAETLVFDYADRLLGIENAKEIELFFIDNPRDQILFKGVSL